MALSRPTYSSRSIDQFRSKLIGAGARPNLFEVQLNWPTGLGQDGNISNFTGTDDTYKFMIKAAALPASNVSVINVPFRGRNLKISGDRSFDPWTITVLNDADFKLRNAFEIWMNFMNRHTDNAGVVTPAAYQTELYVTQLGRGTIVNNAGDSTNGSLPGKDAEIPAYKAYKIHGAFPTNVSEIALSYDTENAIEEFTVTFEYQWWDTVKGSEGSLDTNSLFDSTVTF
jgi:hypothetical protein